MTDKLSIGEVARQAGLRTSAVRYYESVGVLPEPQRLNGRRRYTPDTVQMLQTIQLAQQAGFSITEIRALFYGFTTDAPPAEYWRPLVVQKLHAIEQTIAQAHQMRAILQSLIHCGSARLEDCLLPTPPCADCADQPSG